jgi:hypothetical protein
MRVLGHAEAKGYGSEFSPVKTVAGPRRVRGGLQAGPRRAPKKSYISIVKTVSEQEQHHLDGSKAGPRRVRGGSEAGP